MQVIVIVVILIMIMMIILLTIVMIMTVIMFNQLAESVCLQLSRTLAVRRACDSVRRDAALGWRRTRS